MNVGGSRETFVTLDYGPAVEPDTETLTLFLTRTKPRPMPAIVDKRGLVTMYGRATSVASCASSVPRMSLLVRLDKQQRTALSRMRRRYFVAVGLVFALGMLAGALATQRGLRASLRTAITTAAARAAR